MDFFKTGIGPIFFKEISFFDFLEESMWSLARTAVKI